jgi:ABC-type multidrug transport system ATPase subunit
MSVSNVLDFQDICYDVVIKTGPGAGSSKRILHDVTAQCVSGRLTALMGPSGAGKSSLVGLHRQHQPNSVAVNSQGGASGHPARGLLPQHQQ